jgi:hypothetical protein
MTTQQKVLEAVAKALEMIAARNEARAMAAVATAAANQIKADSPVASLEAASQAKMNTAVKQKESEFEKAEAVARQPLERAQSAYDKKVQDARTLLTNQVSQLEEQFNSEVASAHREQELKEATAQAESHAAKQRVSHIQTEFEQYCKEIQQQLGISLKTLVLNE